MKKKKKITITIFLLIWLIIFGVLSIWAIDLKRGRYGNSHKEITSILNKLNETRELSTIDLENLHGVTTTYTILSKFSDWKRIKLIVGKSFSWGCPWRILTKENREIVLGKEFIEYELIWLGNLELSNLEKENLENIKKNKYIFAKKDWIIQSKANMILLSLIIALFMSITSMAGILLAFVIIAWLWYFILKRINELSRAIRD